MVVLMHREITGRRFGRLTALEQRATRPRATWLCLCDCGNTSIVDLWNLIRHTRSCGCLAREASAARQKTHGKWTSRAWRAWQGMRTRCLNTSDHNYPAYGGRGIAICERWSRFSDFYTDMGDPPAGATLDRINVNGNYEPSNCRWATAKQQARNRRNNVVLVIDGVARSLAEWCEIYQQDYYRVHQRIQKHGWDAVRALTTPRYGRKS